ncbi:MAG: phage tail tube protein [Sphingobium sp.]
MTDALTGYGSEFWLADENGALWEMGELIALEPGSEEWGTTEATHFKSPGRRREYIKTLIESGQGSFQLNWLPGSDTDQRVSNAHADEGSRAFKIVVPSTTGTWEIAGSVNVLSRTPTIPIDDRMTCQVTLQFTGDRSEQAGA